MEIPSETTVLYILEVHVGKGSHSGGNGSHTCGNGSHSESHQWVKWKNKGRVIRVKNRKDV